MGDVLLLQWCGFMGLVLRLPLLSSNIRCDTSRRPLPGSHFLSVDMKGVDKMSFNFELGQPFKPFEQLMSVLPEGSRDLVPSAYHVRAGLRHDWRRD